MLAPQPIVGSYSQSAHVHVAPRSSVGRALTALLDAAKHERRHGRLGLEHPIADETSRCRLVPTKFCAWLIIL